MAARGVRNEAGSRVSFAGLAQKGRVETIKFVDMKTGDGRLSRGQRQIRDRVLNGKVSLVEPEGHQTVVRPLRGMGSST